MQQKYEINIWKLQQRMVEYWLRLLELKLSELEIHKNKD